jgi:hypothetical protein
MNERKMLTDGSPVPEDRSHAEIDPKTGMQRAYVVLSDEERAQGFVRPLRFVYRHLKCGQTTRMGQKIAETYARNPEFYTGTYCAHCGSHHSLDQFVWDGTEERVGS